MEFNEGQRAFGQYFQQWKNPYLEEDETQTQKHRDWDAGWKSVYVSVFNRGVDDFSEGKGILDNPYPAVANPQKFKAWEAGWNAAQTVALEQESTETKAMVAAALGEEKPAKRRGRPKKAKTEGGGARDETPKEKRKRLALDSFSGVPPADATAQEAAPETPVEAPADEEEADAHDSAPEGGGAGTFALPDVIPEDVPRKKLELPVKLTETEMLEKGANAASAQIKINDLTERKKAIVAEYKERIEGWVRARNEAFTLIQSGEEIRHVECVVFYNRPENKMKTTVRIDTEEVVKVEAMDAFDFQLIIPGIEAAPAAPTVAEIFKQDVANPNIPDGSENNPVPNFSEVGAFYDENVIDPNNPEDTGETPAPAPDTEEEDLGY